MFSYEHLFSNCISANYGYAEVRLFKRFDSANLQVSYLVMYSKKTKRYFHRSKYFDSYSDALSCYAHYSNLVSKL